MSEDKAPEAPPDAPSNTSRDDRDQGANDGLDAAPGDDVLRRAARAIRGATSLQAFAPLNRAEREQLADAAVAQAAFERSAGGAGFERSAGNAGTAVVEAAFERSAGGAGFERSAGYAGTAVVEAAIDRSAGSAGN
jgi:hypothetical protein